MDRRTIIIRRNYLHYIKLLSCICSNFVGLGLIEWAWLDASALKDLACRLLTPMKLRHGPSFRALYAMLNCEAAAWSFATARKFNRFEKRHSNMAVHCSPAFEPKEGDIITAGQCRPLAKTVRFNVLKEGVV